MSSEMKQKAKDFACTFLAVCTAIYIMQKFS